MANLDRSLRPKRNPAWRPVKGERVLLTEGKYDGMLGRVTRDRGLGKFNVELDDGTTVTSHFTEMIGWKD